MIKYEKKSILQKKPGFLKSSIIIISTAIIYFITARLSLQLAVGNTHATSVWPPSGIALAVIFIWGYRMGPAIFLGAFFANILTLKGIGLEPAYYLIISFITATGNMLEGLTGAYLIKRLASMENPFCTIKDLFVFIIFGSLLSTMISATLGAGSFCFNTGKWNIFFQIWLTWWLGDATGVLIVSPIIIFLKRKEPKTLKRVQSFEAVIVFLILIFSTFIIFWYKYKIEYVIIPPLIWIALRFGRLLSALAVFLVSGIAVFCIIKSADPTNNLFSHTSLLYLQSYIGVISIITLCLSVLMFERGETEKSLSAAQKQLYDIIEFLPDATFAIDNAGRVIAWNRAIEELSGVAKRDMLGRSNYEYSIPFYGERRPILIDLVIKISDQAQLETYESIVQRDNVLTAERYNSEINRHLSGAASVLLDSDGNVSGAIESIRDISAQKSAERNLKHYKEHLEDIVEERSAVLLHINEELITQIEKLKRMEKNLAASEKNYRDLVESANSIIMRWKPDGSVSFFNTYAQNFFGFTEEEIIGRNVVGTIVPARESSGRDLELLMKNIIRNPGAYAFNENENIKKNGEKTWISWTNKPIMNEEGVFIEILSVGNDITGRKHMEESLKNTLNELAIAKERAEAADRIKSAFLATMSHELRTPLNSIIGFTGIILKGLAGPLNEEQEKQMGMVRNSSQHLLSLINDVLDISKIEAGQLEVYSEPFDLRFVIEKAVSAMEPSAEKKGLALNSTVGREVGSIIGDERRVEQVLLNLLNNAIKFTEHGSVNLAVSLKHNYKSHDADTKPSIISAVQFKITDTGIGIHPENLSKLFQPFQQIDTGLTRKAEGTGLGLAICRRLVDLMGGEIYAESEWEQGSTFTFIIPQKKTETNDTENTPY